MVLCLKWKIYWHFWRPEWTRLKPGFFQLFTKRLENLEAPPIYRTGQTSSRLKTKENIYCCCITYYLQEEKEDKRLKVFRAIPDMYNDMFEKSLWSKNSLLLYYRNKTKQIFFQISLTFFLRHSPANLKGQTPVLIGLFKLTSSKCG